MGETCGRDREGLMGPGLPLGNLIVVGEEARFKWIVIGSHDSPLCLAAGANYYMYMSGWGGDPTLSFNEFLYGLRFI